MRNTLKRIKLIKKMKEETIPLDAVTEAVKQIDRAYTWAGINPRGVCISGESGTGKTTILEHARKKYPKTEEDEGDINPIIYAKIPAKPSVKGLASAILNAFDDPMAKKGTEIEKTFRLQQLFHNSKTKILMLDEFQHFVDQKSRKVLYHVADWLKVLVDDSKVSLVVAGLPYLTDVIHCNEQLLRRFKKEIKTRRFDWTIAEHQVEFKSFLETLQLRINKGFSFPDLSSEDMAYRFFIASGGLVSKVADMLTETMQDAIDDNRKTISLEDMNEGYIASTFQGRSPKESPFLDSFPCVPDLKLIQKVMALKEDAHESKDYSVS